ncbi:MAG: glycosyltransferase [Candidatus Levybacteria bacterium]|nr:glycosyltransferase [Candidatus Levybacteria bacterium]
MKNIFLSVVIPAYNEEENVRRGVLFEVWRYLKRQNYPWEVIIVDDGSTDRTAKLITSFVKLHKGFSLLLTPHSGKAGAIAAGFKKVLRSKISSSGARPRSARLRETKGHILLFTDFDQSVPISEVKKLLPLFPIRGQNFFSAGPVRGSFPAGARASEPLLNALRAVGSPPASATRTESEESIARGGGCYDIIIGSRVSRQGAPILRKIAGYGFILLQKLLIGLPYHDTQCGFKAFRRDAIYRILKCHSVGKSGFAGRPIESHRMRSYLGFQPIQDDKIGYAPTAGFDLELLMTAQRLGLKVAEVPVAWRHKEKSTFNVLKVSFLALIDIINIRRSLH